LVRINLFPTKKIKRKIAIFNLIAINIFLLIILSCGFFGIYQKNSHKIQALNKSIEVERKKLQKLAYLRRQIRIFKKNKKILTTKLKIINQLDSNRLFPSYLFFIISKTIPKDMWLTQLEMNKDGIKIRGISLDEDIVVKFINNLKASNSFKNVNLIQINQRLIQNIKLKEFYITLTPDFTKLQGFI